MKQTENQKLLARWTEKRIRLLTEYYDNQSEEAQVAEHGSALSPQSTCGGNVIR